MAWIEWMKIFMLIIGVFGALSAPFVYIWKRSEQDKKDNSEEIKSLISRTHEHDVKIASLEQGKVGHEQMQEAIQRLETSTNNQIASVHNKIDKNHYQYREDLNRNMDSLKSYIKDILPK